MMVEEIRLENVETKSVLIFNMTTTQDFILDSVDWGVVESTHHSHKYVNQPGASVTGTSLETRAITIMGWIIADEEFQMTQRKTILNRFFNPQQAIDLFYQGYKIRFFPSNSIGYPVTVAENNEVMCKFKIDGLCPDPLFTEKEQTKIVAADVFPMFHFPLIISKEPIFPGGIVFGYSQPNLLMVVNNRGAVSTGMTIVFKAKGTLENPSLTNASTQSFFKVNKVLQSGEQVVVNTTIGEKKVRGLLGDNDLNYFKYKDLGSEWLQLEVGDNLFRYDAEVNVENLEVTIYYGNKFLEVQECY